MVHEGPLGAPAPNPLSPQQVTDMKKSLIAMAVLAAAGAASAQSSVQLYGVADVWFGTTETGVGADNIKQTGLSDGGVSNSRFGLKGSEDLGGGLKAVFTLEQGFSMDTGAAASAGFNRETSVGVEGSFGTVKLGKQFNAFDDVSGAASSVFDSDLAPINTVFASTSAAANPSNSIKYTSPSFNGFTGSVSYAFSEDKTAAQSAGKQYALSGQYANGPLTVGLGYAKFKLNDGDTTFVGSDSPFFDDLGVVGADASTTRLNGSYNFGPAVLKGSFGRVKLNDIDFKVNEYEIGVDVPLAANLTLSAGYAQSKGKLDGDTAGKTTGFGAAVAYSLSKRTTAYAGFNTTKDKDAAGDTIDKLKIFAVGVKHTF